MTDFARIFPTSLQRFLALVGGELGLAAELDAMGHCALATFARALAYQVALKVGYREHIPMLHLERIRERSDWSLSFAANRTAHRH
jgi:hypothetical protein